MVTLKPLETKSASALELNSEFFFSLLFCLFLMFPATWTGQCLSQISWLPALWTRTSTFGISSKNN